MTLTIHVTADDIANGERGSCACCPVALAMARALGHRNVMVAPAPSRLSERKYQAYTGDGAWRNLPDDVGQRIARFDEEGLMEPFSFQWSVTR